MPVGSCGLFGFRVSHVRPKKSEKKAKEAKKLAGIKLKATALQKVAVQRTLFRDPSSS
jgi:hypothetical protein